MGQFREVLRADGNHPENVGACTTPKSGNYHLEVHVISLDIEGLSNCDRVLARTRFAILASESYFHVYLIRRPCPEMDSIVGGINPGAPVICSTRVGVGLLRYRKQFANSDAPELKRGAPLGDSPKGQANDSATIRLGQ